MPIANVPVVEAIASMGSPLNSKALGGIQTSSRAFQPILSRVRAQPPSVQAPPRRFTVTMQDYWKNALPVMQIATVPSGHPSSAPQGWDGKGPRGVHAAEITTAIDHASRQYGVPKKLVAAVIHAESGFNPHAVSRAGAKGLMQLMDGTARTLEVRNSFDIKDNVQGGTRYLRQLLDAHHQNVPLALAAYNAGPARVEQYGGIPPYRETREYVSRVMKYYTS